MRVDFISAGLISLAVISCSENTGNPVLPTSSTLSSSSQPSQSSSSITSSNLSSSSAQNLATVLMDASQVDEYGFAGSAVLAPDADFGSGGSSEVLSPTGTHLGGCAVGASSCTAQWNIGTSLGDGSVSSTLKISDFIPSSKSGWGWSSAGWVLIPKPSGKPAGTQTWLDLAGPIGLKTGQTLVLDLQYSAGEKLILEMGSDEVKAATAGGLSAPPRYSITGTGARTTLKIPLTSIKPDSWSSVKSYDPSKYTNLKLLRIVAASSQGQSFPSVEASKSPALKIYKVSVE